MRLSTGVIVPIFLQVPPTQVKKKKCHWSVGPSLTFPNQRKSPNQDLGGSAFLDRSALTHLRVCMIFPYSNLATHPLQILRLARLMLLCSINNKAILCRKYVNALVMQQ